MAETLWTIGIVVGIFGAVMTTAGGLIWLERRLLGLWQDRYGPNRVGPFGILQVLADMLKSQASLSRSVSEINAAASQNMENSA